MQSLNLHIRIEFREKFYPAFSVKLIDFFCLTVCYCSSDLNREHVIGHVLKLAPPGKNIQKTVIIFLTNSKTHFFFHFHSSSNSTEKKIQGLAIILVRIGQ